MLLILSPVQFNREQRNINKTKLDAASLRFPPLQGPCGSWAQAVKGGDCATTAISYPTAQVEFLRLGVAIAEGLAEGTAFAVLANSLLALLRSPAELSTPKALLSSSEGGLGVLFLAFPWTKRVRGPGVNFLGG